MRYLTLYILFLLFTFTSLNASDTLFFKSLNGRYDCKIICESQKGTYSEAFIKQLSQTKLGQTYTLNDSTLIVDNKDTIQLPKFNLEKQGNYVSAHKCFHQRNYSLAFKKSTIDSYTATLTILTDWRQTTTQQLVLILQPFQLISKGNFQYKELDGNLKFSANVPENIIMENLFIENEPCPRTIMFPK
jgi:hypothetical protein